MGLQDIFPFEKNQTIATAHLASCSTFTTAYVLWVRWPGLEADHSPQSSAEVKNKRSYASTPALRLYGVGGEDFKMYFVSNNFHADYKPPLSSKLWLISFIVLGSASKCTVS
jgi:hypothetical protein